MTEVYNVGKRARIHEMYKQRNNCVGTRGHKLMHVKHLLCHFMHRPLFSPFHWLNLTFTSHAVKQLITTISPQLFFLFLLYLY